MSSVKLNTTGGSGGSVALKGPASTTGDGDIELTLPVDDGTANQYLKTDGNGITSWGTVSSTPEGTAILSTGVSGTSSYLRADGDGTSSWQTVAGGIPDIGNTVTGAFALDRSQTIKIDAGQYLWLTADQYVDIDAGQYMDIDVTQYMDIDVTQFFDLHTAQYAKINANQGVALWHNGAKKIETQVDGARITGGQYTSELELYTSDGTQRGQIYVTNGNDAFFKAGHGDTYLKYVYNGAVELYHDNIKRFETTSNGATIAGDLGDNGGGKTGKVYSNYWVHRHGQSGGVAQNESEAMFIYGGLHFFGDYITMSNSNFSHGLTGNRSYAMLAVHQEGSGAAIHAEDGAITEASDYRIKENVNVLGSGIDKVKALKPITYTLKKSWKPSGNGEIYHGFIAHEVDETLSGITGIVCGKKDAMAPELYSVKDEEEGRIPAGKKVMDETGNMTTDMDIQSVDYGKLTPILTAALKEAIAKIEILETKVAALEAG